MQIGFVNFNTEEKKRVSKIMQLLQDSEAVEELGTGRVRDHFSNTLFPGTSTLQHHAKYFIILPSLFYHTAFQSKKFSNIEEIDRYIKEAEVHITRQLSEKPDGTPKTDVTGITGIDTYKEALKDYRKFVKYDPVYIYGSGLSRFGIIPQTPIKQLILELNRQRYADPHYKKGITSEDNTDDSNDLSGDIQLIKKSEESYDFFNGKSIDIALSKEEARFLTERINETCQDTLLHFLINSKYNIPIRTDYYNILGYLEGLDQTIVDIYNKSVLFSKLIHLIEWRYNYCYFNSFGITDKAEFCVRQYVALKNEYQSVITDKKLYYSLFDYIAPIDLMIKDFCKDCYEAILDERPDKVDELVKSREYTVKRERRKIGNTDYSNKDRSNPTPNTFRWETVRIMVNEIRNPQ